MRVSLDLGRRLLATGAIHAGELRRALFDAATTERPFLRALIEASATARTLLERPLEDGDHPVVRAVVPHPDLVAALPPGLAYRLLAVPLRRDPRTGTIDLAVVDPADAHVTAEVSFHLGAPVRAIAAPLSEIERALFLVDARPRPPAERKFRTDEYEAAPPPPPPPEESRPAPTVAPPSDEVAVPLVRRARPSLAMPAVQPPPPPRPSQAPPERESVMPLSRIRATLAPPTTTPFEHRSEPPVQMVVDFSAAARKEQEEAMASTRRGTPDPARLPLEARRPPFASLTPVLERIDVAADRDALLEALVRGLATTATCAAILAPRRGKYVGVAAGGALDPEVVRGSFVSPHGSMAEVVGRGERLGALDPVLDRELIQALDLSRWGGAIHVLLHVAYVADRPALILVAFGMGDVLEASRRARVLSTAASAALSRLLKRA